MPYYMHELNPDYNPATGKLHHMTTEELKKLLNDDEQLESMIKDLQQVKNLEAEREMLLASNKSLAEYNLSQEPLLINLKGDIVSKHKELQSCKGRVQKKKQKLDDITKNMCLETTLALLQTAAAEAEEESESLADNFLTGEIGVDQFLESYLSKKKVSHLRRVKSEKMTELLNQARASQNFIPPTSLSHPVSSSSMPPYPTAYPAFNPMHPPYPPMSGL
ncbi:vacuolar protein sorting-associated protein 37B-like [Uloborus diversus]|uniref:vacuolar protein sorting-associated protein 37B-like n=1 Tax=Uloborus diversus TaxID=327109 RepID=UPI00240A3AD7|nr:vacuolar protein sorting-associated protein 37B-like [Uloborus diversus]